MEETLNLIRGYAKAKDDWWIEKQLDILEIQIKIEINNAETKILKDFNNELN